MSDPNTTISQPAVNPDGKPPGDAAIGSAGPSAPPAGASSKDFKQQASAEQVWQERVKLAQEAVAADRKIEAADRADALAARKVLRTSLGNEYAPTMRVLRGFLGTLTPERRDEILREELPDGKLAANDPATLIKVLGMIVDDKAMPGKSRGEELEEMRRIMREDRKRWNKDEALQLRYRMLLRAQG